MSSLQKRILSALVMLPVAVGALWYGGWFFLCLVIGLAVVSVYEWGGMVLSGEKKLTDFFLLGAGYVYILLACSAMLWLRIKAEDGLLLTLLAFAMVWATDICAYFSGKTIGGPKLAPKISPNKTWAGLIGGMIGAGLVAIVFGMDKYQIDLFAEWSVLCLAVLGAVFAVIGQVGDFMISGVKRHYGVKDTGSIIPGHGGILDRIDALLLVVPVFVVFAMISSAS